jgi:asparagine synthase (glutamine-hydrolysing)
MLPDSITRNRKKIGFNTPFTEYISDDPSFRSYVFNTLNSKSFSSKNIWKADKVINVFKNPLRYPEFPFWRIINLEVWSKVYEIDNL